MSMLTPMFRNHPLHDALMLDPFDFFNPVAPREVAPTVMRTDITETENGFQLNVDLPGFKKEDVKADLKDGYLSISASASSSSEEKNDQGTVLRKERFCGNCSRSFYIGEDIEKEQITAKFENGVLQIDVPKHQEQPKLEESHSIAIA